MKVKNLFYLLPAALLAVACSVEVEIEKPITKDNGKVFYASTENNSTKVWNHKTEVYWSSYDRIGIFDHSTTKVRYIAQPQSGSTSATFYYDDEDSLPVGEQLPYAYAVFPYTSDLAIDSNGTVSMTLSDVQTCDWPGEFSGDSNPMMAVSENNVLLFRNLCGYLVFKFYGTNISITSIKITATGGEALWGPATVNMDLGGVPVLNMAGDNTYDTITLLCEEPLEIGDSSDNSTEFWIAIPPVTLSQGFSITINDKMGGTFTDELKSSCSVKRNIVTRMAPLELVMQYSDIREALNKILLAIGTPCQFNNSPDDWACLSSLFSYDLEGSDITMPSSNYNWFSTSLGYTSRFNNTRSIYLRYESFMRLITSINQVLYSVSSSELTPLLTSQVAELRALRAWAYLTLVHGYQYNYQLDPSLPSLPIITEETEDPDSKPRASLSDLYAFIIQDLDFAVANLYGSVRESKMDIDSQVARGIRARAYLDMGEWNYAYTDACAAAEGYVPASIAEVSAPSFYDINEHNWLWGFDMPDGYPYQVANYTGCYATSSGWLRSFSSNGYAVAGQIYSCISSLLWNKIPSTDVRKGWWVDENLQSPLLNGLVWPGCDDVANASDGGKTAYLPYTNVKFGCKSIGVEANDEDMPLMRVEEMLLIQAEALARMGNEAGAVSTLEAFVCTYRDPSYRVEDGGRSLLDEIWYQRRIELWGEGFGLPDILRLDKPLVRFHSYDPGNFPTVFSFNMAAGDPWMLMRFPNSALSTNSALVDNTGGGQPEPGQNPDLLDGVTD